MGYSQSWLSPMATAGMVTSFSTVAKGFSSGITEPTQVAIRTRDEWAAFWRRHTRSRVDPPSAPPVDFSREMVVGIFMGERGTGGYEVEITKVERDESHLRVSYRATSPDPGAILIQALTQPYHVIKLPRDDRRVIFSRESGSR
jgi:protease stability complex PrcB-like protein